MKNKKVIILAIVIVVFISLVSIILVEFIKLKNNETFYKENLNTGLYQIYIPKYSYYCGGEGNIIYRFKSIRSRNELDKEIEQILQNFEKKSDNNGNIYYYDKNQNIELIYTVDNDGFFRDILVRVL